MSQRRAREGGVGVGNPPLTFDKTIAISQRIINISPIIEVLEAGSIFAVTMKLFFNRPDTLFCFPDKSFWAKILIFLKCQNFWKFCAGG